MDINEWNRVLSGFKDRIEVIKLEIVKDTCPFYKEFLEDRDIEKYRSDLGAFTAILCKLQLFSILNGTDEEKQRVFEVFREEQRKMINKSDEIYMEVVNVIIRKIN